MANKIINTNGFDYVDLDLPSGTLWATMNVGAKKPADYGCYFQWGDTIGYTKDQVGTGYGQKKFEIGWNDYKFGIDPNFTKYNTLCDSLDLEDDAAHINMGGDWHIPMPKQVQELIDNTTATFTTNDDVEGMIFTSKNDTSKSIFIPAAGEAWDGSVGGNGSEGAIWSSMLSTYDTYYGHSLYFFSRGAYLLSDECRYLGFPVRGVIG